MSYLGLSPSEEAGLHCVDRLLSVDLGSPDKEKEREARFFHFPSDAEIGKPLLPPFWRIKDCSGDSWRQKVHPPLPA